MALENKHFTQNIHKLIYHVYNLQNKYTSFSSVLFLKKKKNYMTGNFVFNMISCIALKAWNSTGLLKKICGYTFLEE